MRAAVVASILLAGCASTPTDNRIWHTLGESWRSTSQSIDHHACYDSAKVCEVLNRTYYCSCQITF